VLDTDVGLLDVTAARVAFLERSYPVSVARRVGEAQIPPDLKDIIAVGAIGLDWVREAADAVIKGGVDATAGGQKVIYQKSEVTLLAPIPPTAFDQLLRDVGAPYQGGRGKRQFCAVATAGKCGERILQGQLHVGDGRRYNRANSTFR
jgi:hypothetical protein